MALPLRTTPLPQVAGMKTRMECQSVLAELLQKHPEIAFASIATVDGRNFAHANGAAGSADPHRSAAIMSSLMGLIESFGREALGARTLYNSIATEHGSIVMVRIPSAAQLHVLCLCADEGMNLAMMIRTSRDTADDLAAAIDASN